MDFRALPAALLNIPMKAKGHRWSLYILCAALRVVRLL
jgi:hypothetical protein